VKYLRLFSTDPYYNLAAEEYLLHNVESDDFFMLWQNAATVVIGRHQNAVEEVNVKRAEELGIKIVRRNSGGGAVYHDLGNLNFSFITAWDPEKGADLDIFLDPVIRGLRSIGVNAERRGRNDLVAGGKKISGNAQYIHGGRILHHGTILVNSQLSVMPEVLNVQNDKIISKGIKSVRSRVANICESVPGPIDIEAVADALKNSLFTNGCAGEYSFTDEQVTLIKKLAAAKYGTWEWNFASSPDFSCKKSRRFPGGKIEVHLDVKDGFIEKCGITGDFLALTGVEKLENAVTGCRNVKGDLSIVLGKFDIPRYYSFTLDELLECFG